MPLSRRRERLVGRLQRRKTREREGLFLVEGIRTAREALVHGADVHFALASPRLRELTDGAAVVDDMEERGVDVDWVEDSVLAGLSDTETPQGLLLVCREPEWTLDQLMESGAGRLLLLDAVQDPGNLGTLVRAAAAFGLPGVVALDGTVDPWNPKSVRASAGALFLTRVVGASWSEVGPRLGRAGVTLLASGAGGEDVAGVRVDEPWALVVGNEGRGVRAGIRSASHRTVAVPMSGPAESLNAGVAGAILLYALAGRRNDR